MAKKLTSRKFWISVAAFLASIGAGIAGITTENAVLAAVGVGCTVVSAAIYAACEAYVDGKSAESNLTVTENTTTSSTALNATTATASVAEKLIPYTTSDDTKIGGTA